ncbi:MAG: GAF domain-containing protein [Elusimicrobia bacterium]|nr:GAF domain-containing protein [Elusimicrobiota bacterium]
MTGRKTWLYEVPVYSLLVLAAERSLSGAHPDISAGAWAYWLGVLLFSLRYGAAAGSFAGLSAAAFYLGGLWSAGERYRFEDVDFYALPVLFMVVGAAVGAVIDRYLVSARRLESRVVELKERAAALQGEIDILQKTNRAVTQQVVSQMSSLVTLYQGSLELGKLDREALLAGILSFFSEALQAGKAALYLKDGDLWRLHAAKGWKEGESYPRVLDHTQGLVGRAGSEGRVVSLKDWFGADFAKAWEGRASVDAVMAGPLRRGAGEVIGVFSVQDLPFLAFNSANLNLMMLLLDWAGQAIEKSFYFEELRSKSIMDEVLNVYNQKYFEDRSEQEFSRSKTYALPFSMLLVGVPSAKDLPVDRQVNLYRALGRLLTEKARTIDIVTKFREDGIPFAVLMMTATIEQASELRFEVLRAYDHLGLDQELRIGIGTYAPEMDGKERMVDQAKREIA